VRQDLPQVAEIEAGSAMSTSSLASSRLSRTAILSLALGRLDSGPCFFERLVLGQSLDEVNSVLYELFDAGTSLVSFGLKPVNLLELL
jgi:hypothetical protein